MTEKHNELAVHPLSKILNVLQHRTNLNTGKKTFTVLAVFALYMYTVHCTLYTVHCTLCVQVQSLCHTKILSVHGWSVSASNFQFRLFLFLFFLTQYLHSNYHVVCYQWHLTIKKKKMVNFKNNEELRKMEYSVCHKHWTKKYPWLSIHHTGTLTTEQLGDSSWA